MLPHDVLRTAASTIRAGGLSQGCHARDAQDREVELFATGSGETGKASINPNAVKFSIYGAVAAACSRNACNPSAIWPVLATEAAKVMAGKAAVGGSNHLHPLILLSEHMDTTTESAAAFLETLADTIKPADKVAGEVA